MLDIHVLSLFPDMFTSPFQESILDRAQKRHLLRLQVHNIRDFTTDRHRVTDDIPYGGGPGMVMKPEPLVAGIQTLRQRYGPASVILLSPQGERLTQARVKHLALEARLVLICGHYSGVDARVEPYVDLELSIGDYVLTGGELPAMVLVDAVARMLPEVLGDEQSAAADSLFHGLLQGPVYTRPSTFEGVDVPSVLRSGNHAEIALWRRRQALRTTYRRRPELLQDAPLSPEDHTMLREIEASEGPDETWS